MLPSRGVIPEGAGYDGRYGDEAMMLLMKRIWNLGVDPASFRPRCSAAPTCSRCNASATR
jgi:hypothetical protein